MNNTRTYREMTLGDAAVDGLLNGILGGFVMAVIIVGVETLAGVFPLAVLSYFAISNDASPFAGLFTHVAISGIYGAIFGIIAIPLSRRFAKPHNTVLWLVAGALFGLLVFAVAEGIILPRTVSPLRELPLWVFALAHLAYGIVLGWLTSRNK